MYIRVCMLVIFHPLVLIVTTVSWLIIWSDSVTCWYHPTNSCGREIEEKKRQEHFVDFMVSVLTLLLFSDYFLLLPCKVQVCILSIVSSSFQNINLRKEARGFGSGYVSSYQWWELATIPAKVFNQLHLNFCTVILNVQKIGLF